MIDHKLLRTLALLAMAALCLTSLPAAAQPLPQPPLSGVPVSLVGTFTLVWGDPNEGAGSGHLAYMLAVDSGSPVRLWLDDQVAVPFGGVLALDGRRVAVQGQWAGSGFHVQALQPLPTGGGEGPGVEGTIGPQPWVSVMCKFADIPSEPRSLPYFEGMYAGVYPGLDHYWREVSYDTIDVAGSDAVGWYTLPQPRSYYVYDNDGDGQLELDWGRAAVDCTAVADADVYFPDFVGINLMFNYDLDCCAWGGGWYLQLDGVGKVYNMTWEPPWGYQNVGVMAHEMGHGFGLPHSSGDYGQVYDNEWDVMSGVWAHCENSTHPVYGCLGQDTISYHLDLQRWIPEELRTVVMPGSQATINLERLDLPQAGDPRVAIIPVQGSLSHFYTVEARRKVGYDIKLPDQGVIIHEVITTRPEPAHVVDIDGNGHTGDEGAIWRVGESFVRADYGITVRVDAATPTGWTVTVITAPLNEIEVNSTAQSPGGSGDCTLGEAIQAANADAAVDGCAAGVGVDRILLPAGTYSLTQVNNNADGPNGLPDVTSGIVLQGAGVETTVVRRQAGTPPFRLFHVAATGVLQVSGITVGGGEGGSAGGGGLYSRGSLALSACRVTANKAVSGGGLFLVAGGSAVLSATAVDGNVAAGAGGGLFNGGTVQLTSCQISGNSAGAGGGIHNSSGVLTLTSTEISDNIASSDGGGLYDSAGLVSVDGGSFIGNSHGALYTNSGTLTLAGSAILDNSGGWAGGLACWYCRLTFLDGALYRNQGTSAGAVYLNSGQPLYLNGACLTGNGDTAVDNDDGPVPLDATGSWWGAADGPSGVGGGSGDSVSDNVEFVPFLAERPAHCPELPWMSVAKISLRGRAYIGGYKVLANVAIRDAARQPVTGAATAATWTLPDGAAQSVEATTNANGVAAFRVKSPLPGVYRLCVDGVTRSGWSYDPDRNRETCDQVSVP